MPKTFPKTRLALALIIKDDSEAVMYERMLNSFMPHVDGLYVAITGPSGKHSKIRELTERFGGTALSTSIKTHPEIYKEVDGKVIFANFAVARQTSFDMVEDGYDYILWADVDDVLGNGSELREVAGMAKEKGIEVVSCTYWYAVELNEQGQVKQVILEQYRERLIKPGTLKWASRIHEVAIPLDRSYKPKYNTWLYNPAEGRKLVWIHLTEEERVFDNIARNKMLLEWELEDTKWKDPRPMFYLAKVFLDESSFIRQKIKDNGSTKELMDKAVGADNRALELLQKYNGLSGWEEERASAIQYAGLIYLRNNDLQSAIESFHEGIKMHPVSHMNYLRLVDAYYRSGHKAKGDYWLAVSDKLPAPSSQTIGATIADSFEIKLLSATLHFQKAQMEENLQEAKAYAMIRAELMGVDDGLVGELEDLEKLDDAVKGLFQLSKWLNDNDMTDTAKEIMGILPTQILDQPATMIISNNILDPKVWEKDSIVYFASSGGPHFEKWGPDNMKTGIGGSETAVIQLAKEWAKKGKKVTVYCDCGDQAGVHDGVEYKPYTLFNYKDEFDTLILWRSPHLLDRDIKANKLLMDLHDVPSQLDWGKDRYENLDKILVKSEYHRAFLPDVPDSKFVVIGNGVINYEN